MKNLKNKSGISLIVLVITIIVMIILATAIILSLNSSNIIAKAKWAKTTSDRANLQAEYATILANAMTDKVDGKETQIKLSDLKETTEYKAWAQKVADAGFAIEEPAAGDNASEIKVVANISEEQMKSYGLEYDEANNGVVGYDWVNVEKEQVKVDGVTIPAGFVASIYDGEKTKAEGLVIYETDSLEGIDHETAMTSYNQFVWVPVEDMSKFERTTTYDGTITAPASYYTEPSSTVCSNFSFGMYECMETLEMSISNDLTGEWAEYDAMRASVQENKGFYIGRYETGTNVARTGSANGTTDVFVQKGKTVYNYVGWGPSMISVDGDVMAFSGNQGKGAVQLSKNMYVDSTSVVSTLCYGVQWDSALQFIYNSDNTYPTTVGDKGNYTGTIINTGSNDAYAVNNIYDMAGNVCEWTMETAEPSVRVFRGGASEMIDLNYYVAASGRYTYDTYPSMVNNLHGFRVALYLK